MRSFLIGIFIVASSAQANQETLSFKNDREGKSYYENFINKHVVRRAKKHTNKTEILEIYHEALKKQDVRALCAYDLNNELSLSLEKRSIDIDLKALIYILRQENEIDDVVAKILLTANKVKSTLVINKDEALDTISHGNKKINEKMELIGSFEKRFAKKSCLDEAYRNYYSALMNLDSEIKPSQVESLNLAALQEKRISDEIYTALEQARINELEKSSVTLSSYYQKIRILRSQYPLRDINEKSDFTSTKFKKLKSSLRQRLFENYTDLQIIIMGNVIKKLRSRLEYDAVEISGYKDGVLQETIPLEPMERFRFAIKALRKEMSLLALNTYFNGRSPGYLDLMIASYEIGIIPATELEAVASLKDIWDPKKTLWDKAGVWVKAFSSVATIAIPPPYGFIPALAIVVIEATVGKKKDANANDPTELF